MIVLNPDKDYVKQVREAIKENDGYCCCSILKTDDYKCPCKEFRENKKCECDLYIEK